MRVLFFITCVVIGASAGLWWTGKIPVNSALTMQSVTNRLTVASTDPLSTPDTTINPAKDVPAVDEGASKLTLNAQNALMASAREHSYNDGIMRVAPAVVSVYASAPEAINKTSQTSQGSGVIVAADGVVLTNLHLIENFGQINVVLSDGRSYPATLIGSDAETDLAVVRIDAAMLPYIRLDEAKPLKVGDIVLAIGNPFGVGQTVTQGIVSATRRRLANGTVWQNFVQIDAAINPGNSGGALINPLGQLVGVNTAVFRGESGAVGIGFAIPADLLAQVVPQIIANGSVSRGWLGLGAEDINMFPALIPLTEQGAVITAVKENGPADLIGVRPMDVIVQLGERPIRTSTQLLLEVSALPPGATVKLALLRSPDPATLNATGDTKPLEEIMYKVTLGIRPTVRRPTLR